MWPAFYPGGECELAKVRVHELAKEYSVKTDEILELLKSAGFPARSHMSGVDEEAVAAVKAHFEGEKRESKKRVRAEKPSAPARRPKVKPAAPKKAVKPGARKRPKPLKGPAKKVAPKESAPPRIAPKPSKARAEQVERKAKPKGPVVKPAPPREPAPARPGLPPKAKKPRPHRKPAPVDLETQQRAVRESVRRTLAKLEVTRRTKRRKAKAREEAPLEIAPVRIPETSTVSQLAAALGVESREIVEKCRELGTPVTIGQDLDREIMELIADDMGKSIEFETEYGESILAEVQIDPTKLKPRAPIVTVMGHVDHGKTTILDYIRKTNVADGEAGGITQHIGAYEVEAESGKITFVDTPGHEAFTAMRARGAKVTDIVVLVVAADDGVMPQTIEAINHTRAAEVAMIVAINKIDLPTANPGKVRQQLAEHGVVVENFGGDITDVEVSGKTGEGIDKLLEMIVLQGELMELKADDEAPAKAVVIEVRKEEGRGILCTVLIKQGTLRIGDTFISGMHCGKVRALINHMGSMVREAKPSTPVVVLGCGGLPEAGDTFTVVLGEREAKEISMKRQGAHRDRELTPPRKLTLEELYSQIQEGSLKELKLVIKADTNGSVEALRDNLSQITAEDVKVKVIHASVGSANESDVLLAASTNALIVAFNVKVPSKVKELAQKEKVEIKSYNIIYECLTEISDALRGMLEPESVERVIGRAEVRRLFKISRLGTIAGSMVVEGSIVRNASVRVLRDGEVLYEGKVSSLKRFRDDVREVQKDFECGIGVTGFSDFREGDILEAYVVEQKTSIS